MQVSLHEGLYVEVYKNLHKKCWSVRHKGKVIWYTPHVKLKNAKLVVQPAGNERVRREGRKNVHAVIRGYLTWDSFPEAFISNDHRITYNPYDHKTFVGWKDYNPITEASIVLMDIDRGVFCQK